MNTYEINYLLRNVKSFCGTFPCDEIPHIKKRPASLVVNTDTATETGEHWVAIYLLPNGNIEYFDSYGLPPLHKQIINYLYKHCKNNIVYNNRTIQDYKSTACGAFCCSFIKLREMKITFYDILFFFNGHNDEKAKIIALL